MFLLRGRVKQTLDFIHVPPLPVAEKVVFKGFFIFKKRIRAGRRYRTVRYRWCRDGRYTVSLIVLSNGVCRNDMISEYFSSANGHGSNLPADKTLVHAPFRIPNETPSIPVFSIERVHRTWTVARIRSTNLP